MPGPCALLPVRDGAGVGHARACALVTEIGHGSAGARAWYSAFVRALPGRGGGPSRMALVFGLPPGRGGETG